MLFMLITCCVPASALSTSRRAVVVTAPAAFASSTLPLPAVGADVYDEISARLDSPILKSPSFTPQPASAPLYPQWLAGRWQCTQTLTTFSTPLGVQFIGAAGRPLSEAEASAAQTRAQIGVPVSLELRWRVAGDGAVEDRAFNAKSRFDAFAGRAVVRESRPCDTDPQAVACTFLDFKGPVSQKLLINRLSVARSESQVTASERASAAVELGSLVCSESLLTHPALRSHARHLRSQAHPRRYAFLSAHHHRLRDDHRAG